MQSRLKLGYACILAKCNIGQWVLLYFLLEKKLIKWKREICPYVKKFVYRATQESYRTLPIQKIYIKKLNRKYKPFIFYYASLVILATLIHVGDISYSHFFFLKRKKYIDCTLKTKYLFIFLRALFVIILCFSSQPLGSYSNSPTLQRCHWDFCS